MATNFSPCSGSYVLNQFPCIVMFDIKGFHISASGAIQGHHGRLVGVILESVCLSVCLSVTPSIKNIDYFVLYFSFFLNCPD